MPWERIHYQSAVISSENLTLIVGKIVKTISDEAVKHRKRKKIDLLWVLVRFTLFQQEAYHRSRFTPAGVFIELGKAELPGPD